MWEYMNVDEYERCTDCRHLWGMLSEQPLYFILEQYVLRVCLSAHVAGASHQYTL